MNRFYILAVILTAVAALGWVVAIWETKNPPPRSGDKRVVKEADMFYLERYRGYPAWEPTGLRFTNWEDARKALEELPPVKEIIFPTRQ